MTITGAQLRGSVIIRGVNTYGVTLTADVLNTDSATLTYQWYYTSTSGATTGGTAISGATNSTYQIGPNLIGKYIYVVVTASKANYLTTTWSDATDAMFNTTSAVAKRPITITAEDQEIDYGDSIDTHINQVTISGSGLANGDILNSIVLTPSTYEVTDDGTITPSGAEILNRDIVSDVTDNYIITYQTGLLVINSTGGTITIYPGNGISSLSGNNNWTSNQNGSISREYLDFDEIYIYGTSSEVTYTLKNGYGMTADLNTTNGANPFDLDTGDAVIEQNSSGVYVEAHHSSESPEIIIIAHATSLSDPTSVTISGGTTKIYGYSSTTLTASQSTDYSGATLYYEFRSGNDVGSMTSDATSTTNTKTISSTEFFGIKYYSVKIYASDGVLCSGTVTSSTTSVRYQNAKVTFNATTNGGTLSDSSAKYGRYNSTTLYTTQTGSTPTTVPTATKTDYVFIGWYSGATSGSKVLNADGSIAAAVSGYTRSDNGTLKWAVTANKTLYARFEQYNYLNETNGNYYNTLNDAFASVSSGGTATITALRNIYESSSATLASGRTVYLDLNGKTVELNDGATGIINDGSLDIYSSSANGILRNEMVSPNVSIIINNGVLTTNATDKTYNITIKDDSDTVGTRIIKNNSGGTVTLNKNTRLSFTSGAGAYTTDDNASMRFLVENAGILNVSGATLTNVEGTVIGGAVFNSSSSSRIVMTSGEMASSGNTIYNLGTGTTTPSISITGGQLYSNEWSTIYNASNGKVSIGGGRIDCYAQNGNKASIYNASGGIIDVSTGIIVSANVGIISEYGSIQMSGGSINGSSGGVDLLGGSFLLTSGTVVSSGAGGGVYVYHATFTMGENTGTPSIINPVVSATSSSYGVGVSISSGTFNFYDGKISSAQGTGYSINGTPNSIPSGYSVQKTTTNGVETAILINSSSNYYQNTSTSTYYSTLSAALSAVASNQTIKVINSKVETSSATLASGKTGVKLDLNGKTIDLGTNSIVNNGTLDIYGTVSGGTISGSNTSTTAGVITNNGTLTVNKTSSSYDLTIANESSDTNARVIVNNASKTVTLNTKAKIKSTAGDNYLIQNNGIVNVSGGTLNNELGGGINITHSSGRVSVTAGAINASKIAINNNNGTGTTTPAVSISGSATEIISGDDVAIYNNSSGKIAVSGGIINSEYSIGIFNYDTGNVTVSGGSIYGYENGLDNYYTGTVQISGGTINGNNNGVFVNHGSVTITGGTIIGNTDGLVVYGTVTLGTNNGTVDQNSPLIKSTATTGSYYGVRVNATNGGTLNFYDGKITSTRGESYTINGTPNSIPTDYIVYKYTDNGTGVAVLSGAYLNVNTGNSYVTLADAFTNVDDDEEIMLLADRVESSGASLTAYQTGVKLDLNGHHIDLGSNYIANYGTLDIYNNSATPQSISSSDVVITNNGTLTLNGTDSSSGLNLINHGVSYTGNVIDNASGATVIVNNRVVLKFLHEITDGGDGGHLRYLVKTAGTFNISGGTLTNTVDSSNNYAKIDGGIHISDASGRVIMSSGEIDVTGLGINNYEGTGTTTPAVSISGGTISAGLTNAISSNHGNVTITGGYLSSAPNSDISTWETATISNRGSGTVNISGGTIDGNLRSIYNKGTGKVNISNATVRSSNYYSEDSSKDSTVVNESTGTITINSGIIRKTATGANTVYNKGNGIIEIKGGSINSVNNNTAVVNYTGGNINMSAGTISSGYAGIINSPSSSGNISVTGGSINGSFGISLNAASTGNLTVSGASTKITGSETGIAVVSSSATISAGSITGVSAGISISSGNVTVTGGTVTGTGATTNNTNYGHGIAIYAGSTVTLGTNDSSVSTTSPLIRSTNTNTTTNSYGVYNVGGTFKFFDGKITSARGTGYSIYGTVSSKPSGYSVNKTTSGGVETAILKK